MRNSLIRFFKKNSAFVLISLFTCNCAVAQSNKNEYKYIVNDTIKAVFVISAFDISNHSVRYCNFDNWKGVCLIDNKPVFGTDFTIPKLIIKKGYLLVNGQVVNLDVSCMYEKPNKDSFILTQIEGGFLLNMGASDGAGSYFVQWQVIKNYSVRTIISNDERLYTIDW